MDRSSEKWLRDYESIEKMAKAISQNLTERSRYPKSSTNYSKLTISIRTLIGKLSAQIQALSKALDDASSQGTLTQAEINRRVGLINQLRTNEKQFEQFLRDETSFQKDVLIGGISTGASTSTNAALYETTIVETPETNQYSSSQLLMQQDRILIEQERGLETLSGIIRNQKTIAVTIGSEVERQNVLIDNMGDKMDQVHDRLINETKKIRLIDRTSGTCGLWMIVILLFVAILVILLIPKP